MQNALLKIVRFIDLAFARAVECLVVVFLLAMMLLVATQVVLRNVFQTGIPWADVASRHMVLWVAFFGAMLATRVREHISIDAITRLLSRRKRNALRIGLDVLASSVAFLLARASYFFVLSEREAGTMLIGSVPTWAVQAIIPFGFAMIALEYAIGVGLDIWRIAREGNEGFVAGRGRG